MFNPTRFSLARKRRGLSKARLAELVGVTPRSISGYEAGETEPSEATLRSVSKVTRFPDAFFHLPDIECLSPEGASFRALKAMTSSKRDAALGAGALAIELAAWIDERFSLPVPNVPDLTNKNPETAAEMLRASWGLGERPVRNMVHLLEAHGVRVFSLAEECREVDAFSFWRDGIPYAFLNTAKSAERGRLDAGHELGHLVLHRLGRPDSRAAEGEAQAFGAALLMPRGAVLGAISGLATTDRLVAAKRNWNVSVAALAHRLHDLGMVTDWHYRNLCVEIAARGYRTHEPNGVQRETSQILEKVFDQLRHDGVTKGEVARELGIDPEEVNGLVFGLVMLPLAGGTPRPAKPHANPKLGVIRTRKPE